MAKMRVHELAKELEIKSQEIIDSLSGTEYEIKSASNNIDDAAQEIIRKKYKKSASKAEEKPAAEKVEKPAAPKAEEKARPEEKKPADAEHDRPKKNPASQPCLTHSTANREQDMEITEDRTREQKAADHRMADAR